MGQIVTANDVAMVTATAPVLAKADRADQNPARVYLARLAPGSRRAQAGALEAISRLLSADQVGAEALPWAELRGLGYWEGLSWAATDTATASASAEEEVVEGCLGA